jgi:alginate O-acetyltransferase complex protein AlgI
MVFSSLTFLFFFLPTCLICYYAYPKRAVRNLILILFSLIFYAWGEPIWVCLLIFSGVWDYLNGMFIDHFKSRKLIARLGLISSLTVNLGLLASFKYADFIVETVNALTGLSFKAPGLLLPIGISFYTFQTISYTVDVYRGEVSAQKNFLNFFLFVVSFHQLVAGPIVRYSHIAREIEERVFSLPDFSSGVTRFCKGLFKKVFIANTAGELSLQFLGQDMSQTTVAGEWFGLLMYSLQIYFDFSGYSDMAIGLGMMFGFHYHENFKHPYTAKSITDFWRRWHISLGTFFRDYVYIPLGGNRRHPVRNIFIVWGLTGLWHGASWNFVLWGLYFGLILWIEKHVLLRVLETLPNFMKHIYAIFFIVLGWAIFFFTDLSLLVSTLKVLFGLADVPFYSFELETAFWAHAYWLVFALLVCTPLYARAHAELKQRLKETTYQCAVIAQNLVFLGVSVVLLVGQAYNPFIYFRF